MRIVQILKVLAFGDAIGNHVIALQKAFRENGIKTKIYAEVIDARLPEGTAEDYKLYERLRNINAGLSLIIIILRRRNILQDITGRGKSTVSRDWKMRRICRIRPHAVSRIPSIIKMI